MAVGWWYSCSRELVLCSVMGQWCCWWQGCAWRSPEGQHDRRMVGMLGCWHCLYFNNTYQERRICFLVYVQKRTGCFVFLVYVQKRTSCLIRCQIRRWGDARTQASHGGCATTKMGKPFRRQSKCGKDHRLFPQSSLLSSAWLEYGRIFTTILF